MNARNAFPSWPVLRRLILSCALVLIAAHTAAAQPKEDPLKRPRMDTSTPTSQPGQPGQPQGGGMVQQAGRPFYLQGAVTVLILGGAVWTVCRSSRRL